MVVPLCNVQLLTCRSFSNFTYRTNTHREQKPNFRLYSALILFPLIWQMVNQGTVAYAGGGLVRDVKNKAVLCKPLTLTKATYCKPHMQSKLLQTGKCCSLFIY